MRGRKGWFGEHQRHREVALQRRKGYLYGKMTKLQERRKKALEWKLGRKLTKKELIWWFE